MKKQTLLFLLMLMPLMMSASTKINGIYYNLNSTNKVAEVTYVPSGTSTYTGSIVIPKTVSYGGVTYSVTSIGEDAFEDCSGLTSITIPNSVTSIRYWAFWGCDGLTSVTIPNSVTSIGFDAFYGCSGLTSVTIPNSVTSIKDNAFSGCSGLTSIKVESGNTVYDSRDNCNAIIETSTNVLIAGCKNATIPNSVTSIGPAAFDGCSGLTSVTIPNSVTSIEVYAFSGCSGLTSVTIPNSVTSIEGNAFSDCSGLTSVTIPNTVTSIGGLAFSGCSALTSVFISDIAAWCKISFEDDEYPDFNPYESNPLFYGHHLFLNGVEVKDLIIPDGVTSIGKAAFAGCSALTSVTIPNSVTSIGNEAFFGCSNFTSVIIPNGVSYIGERTFACCENLTEVTSLANNVPTTDYSVFEESPIENATLYVPTVSLESYKSTSPWNEFGTIMAVPQPVCITPTITILPNGKIKVESATEGATCITNIIASNAEPLTDGEISLNTPLVVYTVTAYATKEGYDDSEVATATFRYEKAEGDMNGDGTVNISDVVKLVNMILGL